MSLQSEGDIAPASLMGWKEAKPIVENSSGLLFDEVWTYSLYGETNLMEVQRDYGAKYPALSWMKEPDPATSLV